jgi:hypothetical protein
VPVLGTGVMTLESAVTPACRAGAASIARAPLAGARLARRP